MKKSKGILVVLVGVLILSGCNMVITEYRETEASIEYKETETSAEPRESEATVSTTVASVNSGTLQTDNIPIPPLNLSTEKDVREYLVGEWFYSDEYVSSVVVRMNIDKKLNVHLSFHDSYTNESKGDYAGQIKFDWAYANPKGAPDLICIELMDTDYPGGNFFFLHRTIYDEKRVMSWFFAGNGNCVFNILFSDDYEYMPEEIMFEKVSGETSQLTAHKNSEFYAVFWGHGVWGQSIWLDDVQWTPPEEGDFAPPYPRAMTIYENDVTESVLYIIAPDTNLEILGDDMFSGEVYFVQTDEHGNIIEIINAEYKEYLENSLDG